VLLYQRVPLRQRDLYFHSVVGSIKLLPKAVRGLTPLAASCITLVSPFLISTSARFFRIWVFLGFARSLGAVSNFLQHIEGCWGLKYVVKLSTQWRLGSSLPLIGIRS